MKIAVKNGKEGNWHRIPSNEKQENSSLQELIYQIPELISTEDIESSGPCVKLCIKNMSAINAESDDGLIGIDDDGQITIVECKAVNGSSVRREILGQALEYAATLWKMTYEEFDDMVTVSEGSSLVELMSEIVPEEEWSEEIFRHAVSASLKQGKFHLIMVTQKITDELKRMMEFLNERGTFFSEIYAVKMQRFSNGETEIAIPDTVSFTEMEQQDYVDKTEFPEEVILSVADVTPSIEVEETVSSQMPPQPTTPVEPVIGVTDEADELSDSSEPVIGQTSETAARKDKRKEALFFAKCQETTNQSTVEIIRKLYVFSMEVADNIMWWGSGGAGAFNFALTQDQLTVFIVDASGKIMFNFSEWQREPAYKSLLPQFLEKLKDISALRKQKGDYTNWPDFNIEEFFSNQSDFIKFEDATRFLKAELNKLVPIQM